jgi:CBS domain-containing protein
MVYTLYYPLSNIGEIMNKISDIMTKDPLFLSPHANVHKARMLMSENSIRHIPIKDIENQELVGMIDQKAVLSNAIKVINARGLENLEHEEKSMPISDIMNVSPSTVEVNVELIDVANSLLKKKSGCVAITDNKQLVGIITSSDFVKLFANSQK